MMAVPRPRISPLEWTVSALASAIVAAAIVTLLVQHHRQRTPPGLTIRIEHIDPAGRYVRVGFAIHNAGGSTAAAVIVQGELETEAHTKEVREVTFDFVPDGSERRGALLFESDPRRGRLSVRPLAYREP
jgi:uncharacterized protein (TIGR02588 family)